MTGEWGKRGSPSSEFIQETGWIFDQLKLTKQTKNILNYYQNCYEGKGFWYLLFLHLTFKKNFNVRYLYA